jgi:hypothetical protein
MIKISALSLALGAALAAAPSTGNADASCEGDDSLECTFGQDPFAFLTDPDDDGSICTYFCWPDDAPPPTPVLECVNDGMNHWCLVWPQSPNIALTYGWSQTPGVSLSNPEPSPSPEQRITCHESGVTVVVGVTVSNKAGMKSDAEFEIRCEEMHEYLPILPIEPPPEAKEQY